MLQCCNAIMLQCFRIIALQHYLIIALQPSNSRFNKKILPKHNIVPILRVLYASVTRLLRFTQIRTSQEQINNQKSKYVK